MARTRAGKRREARRQPPPPRRTPPINLGRSINKMIHGDLGRRLQKIIRRRLRSGPGTLSRCDDRIIFGIEESFGTVRGRTDAPSFQFYRNRNFPYIYSRYPVRNILPYLDQLCSRIRERFVIYGAIGRGSFGYIFAARERLPANDTRRPKQYAVKMEPYVPLSRYSGYEKAPTGFYREVSNGELRYIPTEAIALQLMGESDRFPKIDSTYVHSDFASTFMSADSVDDDENRGTLPQIKDLPDEQFHGYSGELLMDQKRTKITEIQACKVASHILEAMMYLMDMNMSHDDLSHRNYLVDKNLNTQLIDFGLLHVADSEKDFTINTWEHIPVFEYMVSPQVALLFTQKPYNESIQTLTGAKLNYRHDIRVQHLWKFGVLIFDLLHGYSPWETPDYNEDIGEIKTLFSTEMTDEKIAYLMNRRVRIMNEELPVDERLSQDCVDVLRVLLAKEIADRATILELASLPWFQGHWADHPPSELKRPPRAESGSRYVYSMPPFDNQAIYSLLPFMPWDNKDFNRQDADDPT